MAIKIIIAEDHALFRNGLRQLLSLNENLEVTHDVGTAEEAIELCKKNPPDLILLDIALPGLNGLETAAILKKSCPHMKILVISMFSRPEYIRSAFRAGVHGYLLKTADSQEFFCAINTVLEGNQYLSSEIDKNIYASIHADKHSSTNPFDLLTTREQEILLCVAKGLSNKEIANKYFIAEKTVTNHRTNFMRKLSLHNTREITMFAVKYNLIIVD